MPKIKEDLTGKDIAGVKVVQRLESKGEGVLFTVRHPCGHEEEILGWSLRSYAKRGMTRRCKTCHVANGKGDARAAHARAPALPTPERPRPPKKKAAPPKPAAASASVVTPLVHEFPLRRDFTASLSLPSDLSKVDVQRLARWLDVLVFEEDEAATG